jgi:hypothetical protein
VPIGFCVLTCDSKEQALARAGEKDSNKGYAAGAGAIEMAQLSRRYSPDGEAQAPAPAGKRALRRAKPSPRRR